MRSVEHRPKITVLNYSGMGSITGDDTILNSPDYDFNILLNVDDSGGHTGILSEFYKFLNHERNGFKAQYQRLNYDFAHLPIGDFRNILSRWICHHDNKHPDGESICKLLIERVDTSINFDDKTKQIKNKTDELVKLLDPNYDKLIFDNFIDKYIQFLTTDWFIKYIQKQNGFGHTSPNRHSIGNLALDFLGLIYGREMFDILKINRILPRHVDFHFISNKRLILTGEYQKQNGIIKKVYGEAALDQSYTPITRIYYTDPITKKKALRLNANIYKLIETSDWILSFAGSPANRIPLFDILKSSIAKKNSRIILVANAFVGSMDEPLHLQLQSIFDMGIKPLILAPAKEPLQYIKDDSKAMDIFEAYHAEGKTQFNQHTFNIWLSKTKYSNLVFQVLDLHATWGLKYDTHFIAKTIRKIIKNPDKYLQH